MTPMMNNSSEMTPKKNYRRPETMTFHNQNEVNEGFLVLFFQKRITITHKKIMNTVYNKTEQSLGYQIKVTGTISINPSCHITVQNTKTIDFRILQIRSSKWRWFKILKSFPQRHANRQNHRKYSYKDIQNKKIVWVKKFYHLHRCDESS